MDSKITTIITTFHRPEMLRRAVQSVLDQTYPLFRVCIYDNGSDEETFRLMLEFMQKDSRVFYHRHAENIGMMQNYKYAFSQVETSYFSFLSDDDYLSPWFYETALAELEKHKTAAFISCAAQVVDNKNKELFVSHCWWKKTGFFDYPSGFLELFFPTFKPPMPTCTLFRHTFVKTIDFDWDQEIQLLWDPCFLIKIAAVYPFIVYPSPCGYYLAHDEGFSSGFYERLDNSSEGVLAYIKAINKLIGYIMRDKSLSSDLKSKSETSLLQFFRRQMKKQLITYLKVAKIKDAIICAYYMISYPIIMKFRCLYRNKFINTKRLQG